MTCAIALDLGTTTIKAGLLSDDGMLGGWPRRRLTSPAAPRFPVSTYQPLDLPLR